MADELADGRELNKRVAVEVMGLTLGTGYDSLMIEGPFEDCGCPSHDESGALPDYSGDIAEAWLVVERFRDEDVDVEVLILGKDTQRMYNRAGRARVLIGDFHAWAPTVPRAICEAALVAVVTLRP